MSRVLWKILFNALESDVESVSNCTEEEWASAIANGESRPFRLYDGDGILYYIGRMIQADGADPLYGDNPFAPLDDYGNPNDGCVAMRFLNDGLEWEML